MLRYMIYSLVLPAFRIVHTEDTEFRRRERADAYVGHLTDRSYHITNQTPNGGREIGLDLRVFKNSVSELCGDDPPGQFGFSVALANPLRFSWVREKNNVCYKVVSHD